MTLSIGCSRQNPLHWEVHSGGNGPANHFEPIPTPYSAGAVDAGVIAVPVVVLGLAAD